MFYELITQKRNEWFLDKDCPVNDFVNYIIKKGYMRNAQIDAIKTYLFLKIACQNKPLYDLFVEGSFNTLKDEEIDALPLPVAVRKYFQEHPAVIALYEYATMKDAKGKSLSAALEAQLKEKPQEIDYKALFKKIFYGANYTDYLFSLPMGAGKTYLMAAFIYIDLYFAQNEMDNPVFAHNFIILAPSGTKSSIIPSLKTIEAFDPSAIIPEPAATNLKRHLIFEMLDENKTANKSNKTKNPNVQKIAIHQPLQELFGLVAVTNAEKVILDNAKIDAQGKLFELTDDEKSRASNELRHIIGKIPHLGVFIDEVHHAESGEIKLRAVVNTWAEETKNVNSVLGFSGTPYLEKAEKIKLTEDISIKSIEISSIVYYYPLANAIGNFLKVPVVNIRTYTSEEIVREAVGDFLRDYGNTVYQNGTCAKIGIYCGTIENLEENIYPEVKVLAEHFGFNADEIILKNHDGNKKYKVPTDAKSEFPNLDKPFSKKKIVLLVGIGKEGWDCKSLTGVILTQKSECPRNMVLQTSCRALREVTDAKNEKAFVYMNTENAEILKNQLALQHHINLEEFQKARDFSKVELNRYDRTQKLKLPPLDFYQLQVSYSENVIEKATSATIKKGILSAAEKIDNPVLQTAQFTEKGLEIISQNVDDAEHGTQSADFGIWKYSIARESFGFVTFEELSEYDSDLQKIFSTITYEKEGELYFSSKYDIAKVNANIRKSFADKRSVITSEENIKETAKLLRIKSNVAFSKIYTTKPEKYYPEKKVVEEIIAEDNGEVVFADDIKITIETLEKSGMYEAAEKIKAQHSSEIKHDEKDYTYHYLPFYADSNFESAFLENVLTYKIIKDKKLEVYYNGDGNFTEFQIKCHKKNHLGSWTYIGKYTPDFLILSRDSESKIDKVLIVETKGSVYANDTKFVDKRDFAENKFLELNQNMEYLYIEDSLNKNEILSVTTAKIKAFFGE